MRSGKNLLSQSLNVFGFRQHSTQVSQQLASEVTEKLLQLSAILDTFISNKPMANSAREELEKLHLFFDSNAHSFMSAGDTVSSHLLSDSADACSILLETKLTQTVKSRLLVSSKQLDELKLLKKMIDLSDFNKPQSTVRNKT